jgi:hypothetical protein
MELNAKVRKKLVSIVQEQPQDINVSQVTAEH